jgi:hypothetical protein
MIDHRHSFRRSGFMGGHLRLASIVAVSLATLFSVGTPVPRARAERPRDLQVESIEQVLSGFDRVLLDPAGAAAQVRDGQPISIVTPRATFEVTLEPHDIRSPRYRATVSHDGGIIDEVAPGPVTTYRGTVAGMPGAEARFSITDEGLTGLILAEEEWYYVEPERSFSKAAPAASHVVYSRSDMRAQTVGTCANTLAHEIGGAADYVAPQVAEKLAGAQGGGPMPFVEIATEADYEYFRVLGGVNRSLDEILAVLNQVEGVYVNQIGVTFEVVYQNVWDTREDPYDSDDASGRLGEFQRHWNANNATIARDITHFWTAANFDSSTLGIAYVEVVCTSRTFSYGLSTYLASAPGKFILTAHEIGHNFSARHPDQLTPPVDVCDNTIMQSFVGTGFKFCRYSRDQIQSWVSGHSSCLTNNRLPAGSAGPDRFVGQGDTVTLIGSGTDPDFDALSYRWTQTEGPSVTLTGATTAAPSFAAPSVTADTDLVFSVAIEDGRGGIATDTVLVTVVPEPLPGITVTAPAGGSIVKPGKKLKITWTVDPEITGDLKVELSRDGGATFETLFGAVQASAGKKKWAVTAPKTARAIIRLSSVSDPRSQGLSSSVFAID